MKKVFIMTALMVSMIAGSSSAIASTRGRFLTGDLSEQFVVMRVVSAAPITIENLPDLTDFQPQHVKFVRERAGEGNDICQCMLGTLYVKGIAGVQKNYELAADWLRKAYYDGGNDLAKRGLRFLIRKGHVEALGTDERNRLGL